MTFLFCILQVRTGRLHQCVRDAAAAAAAAAQVMHFAACVCVYVCVCVCVCVCVRVCACEAAAGKTPHHSFTPSLDCGTDLRSVYSPLTVMLSEQQLQRSSPRSRRDDEMLQMRHCGPHLYRVLQPSSVCVRVCVRVCPCVCVCVCRVDGLLHVSWNQTWCCKMDSSSSSFFLSSSQTSQLSASLSSPLLSLLPPHRAGHAQSLPPHDEHHFLQLAGLSLKENFTQKNDNSSHYALMLTESQVRFGWSVKWFWSFTASWHHLPKWLKQMGTRFKTQRKTQNQTWNGCIPFRVVIQVPRSTRDPKIVLRRSYLHPFVGIKVMIMSQFVLKHLQHVYFVITGIIDWFCCLFSSSMDWLIFSCFFSSTLKGIK